MRKALLLWFAFGVLIPGILTAQEANAGLDLRATLSGLFAASNVLSEAPRSGDSATAGFRSVMYPTWKINGNWTATGVWQFATRPYFYEDFSTAGFGANGNLLQASLNYSRISDKGSLLIRAGQLQTAFGSFPLFYDDMENALVDLPIEYGYYGSPVSLYGIAGAQIDGSRGKWDGRVQFANSSPANPRSLFKRGQYGNWAGGGGYTIRQGLRVGVSAYRGPYLYRGSWYFPWGEESPSKLPAHALGLDARWAYGHWIVLGEVQGFVFPYTVNPTYREKAGYAELKRVLSPRWYVAARDGESTSKAAGNAQCFEGAAGFRPGRLELVKVSYELEHYSTGAVRNENTFAIQFVTSLHAAKAWH
jgi:hypothetical protein